MSRTVHVRNQGTSHDLTYDDLGLEDGASDRDILTRVANFLDKRVEDFDGHMVDRSQRDAVTIRPQAVFGT